MKSLHLDLRALAAALHDGIAIFLALFAASVLLEPTAPAPLQDLLAVCAVAIPLQVVVNVFFGLYQGVWRYTSLPDIQRIVFATLAGTVLVSGALRVAGLEAGLGWREYVLYPLFLIGIMSMSRMAFRSFKEWSLYGRGGEQGTPVAIMGAGDAAVGLVK